MEFLVDFQMDTMDRLRLLKSEGQWLVISTCFKYFFAVFGDDDDYADAGGDDDDYYYYADAGGDDDDDDP